MTEAVRLLVAEGFRIGFHRLEIRCSSRNERSRRVPERCGFGLDGRLREDRCEGGARSDSLIYGLLAPNGAGLVGF